MLEQRILGIAPNGIVRLIAGTEQTDFIARFTHTEKDDEGTYLVFEPNQDRDYKIRVTNTAPADGPNGTVFYGTEDKWVIRAASPEEVAAFEHEMEADY
jgi:hypothetical protein